MKRNLFLLIILLLAAACDECGVEDKVESKIPINFSSPLLAPTKVTDFSFLPGEQIGIFMLNSGSTLSASTIVDDVNNYNYYVSSVTSFVASFLPYTTDTVFFPTPGNVDFIAYYPYSNSISSTFTCPVSTTSSDQTNRATVDFVYSNNATNISSANVSLVFKHALSFLEFDVVTETGLALTEMVGMTLTLNNFSTTADVNLSDGSIINLNSATQDIVLPGKYYAGNEEYIADGIIVPQTVAQNSTVTFTMTNGRVFTYDFPDDLVFESGKIYIFTVTLDRGTSASFTGSVSFWQPGTLENSDIVAN
ncbi:MAG: fimbrillin family protein [Bacteroidales bacterium]|nr:fimbrillin family protein [Bacteroidales bacterium]